MQFSKLWIHGIAAALISAPAIDAQCLDASTNIRNDRGTLVTDATFAVQAPPGSTAFLFASALPITNGVPIPRIGMLYLNPTNFFPLGTLNVPRTGRAQLRFSFPSKNLDGLILRSQALVVSKPATISLTSWSGIGNKTSQRESSGGKGVGVAYSRKTHTLRVKLVGCAGNRITVNHTSGRHTSRLASGIVPRSGCWGASLSKVGLLPGNSIVVTIDGARFVFPF